MDLAKLKIKEKPSEACQKHELKNKNLTICKIKYKISEARFETR